MTGTTLDARYEVLSLLGSGGMGCVYEVRHQHLGQRFALKEGHTGDDVNLLSMPRSRHQVDPKIARTKPQTIVADVFGNRIFISPTFSASVLVKGPGPVVFRMR